MEKGEKGRTMSNRTASAVKVAVLVAGAAGDVVQVVIVSELAERRC